MHSRHATNEYRWAKFCDKLILSQKSRGQASIKIMATKYQLTTLFYFNIGLHRNVLHYPKSNCSISEKQRYTHANMKRFRVTPGVRFNLHPHNMTTPG